MLMWIILSSAFIAVFLLVRALFSNKIKPTAMYALWILVAVRLLIPTYIPVELNLFENVKIPAITTQIAAVEQNAYPTFNNIVVPDQSGNNIIDDEVQVPIANTTTTDVVSPTVLSDSITPNETLVSIHPLICIWLIGMIAFGCYFIISNIRFHRVLIKKRKLLEQYHYKIPVYYVEGLQSPCMTGIINPGIFINERITKLEEDKYVLDHEFTHYKHKDNIWMLIQLICLCIHWYNPLVWIASVLFRRDCECACDASLIKSLSDEDRILYGKTLLQFAEEKWNRNSIISTSTSMSMEGKTMKKRVHIIINHPPKKLISSLVAIILVIVLFAGAFVVNSSEKDDASNTFAHISVEVLEAGIFQDNAKGGSVTLTTDDGETKTVTPVSLYYSLWLENTGNADLKDLDFKIVANEEFEHYLTAKKNIEPNDLFKLYQSYDSALETFSGHKSGSGHLDAHSNANISCSFQLASDWETLIEKGILKAEDDLSDAKDITDYVYDVTLIIYNEGEVVTRIDLSKLPEASTQANIEMDSSKEDVIYELSLRTMGRNDEIITSNQITIPPGDLVLSLSEEISDDVVNRRVEGDYLDGGLQNAILDIDYPYEMTGLDGTTIVAFEYILKDVKSGDKITVTITKELQERLGLTEDQIIITCEGYDSKIIGSWERTSQSIAIGDVPAELAPSEGKTVTIEATDTFVFRGDKTGKWTTTYDEQHSNLDYSVDFTYSLEGDQLTLKRLDQGTIGVFTISFADGHLLLDGRNVVIDLNRID